MVHKIKLEHFDLRLRIFGNGPLVFFIHGYGGSPNDWDGILEQLKHDFCVVKVDMKPIYQGANTYTFDEQKELLAEVFRSSLETFGENQQEQFHVVATSYGTAVAMAALGYFKNQVKSLTLINPMPSDPIRSMKNNALKILFFINRLPGGFRFFVHTRFGYEMMLKLG